MKAASEAEYPAYGVTGPTTKEPGPGSPGDRKLAHSAQMYHYQHQKQQMLAMEKSVHMPGIHKFTESDSWGLKGRGLSADLQSGK